MMLRSMLSAILATVVVAALPSLAWTESTLRAVMNSDLKILDPIWSGAYVVRDHGYLIYDTLFALDDNGEVQPQMVEKTEVSADKLSYAFTLREGLLWHDGQPVTAEDCVASIKRWAARDVMGQRLMTFTDTVTAKDARTIELKLKEPTGLVLRALGKPFPNVPFMMPKRVADTDPNKQISEFIGSGPFIFRREEWKPGDRTVYIRNPKYRPRLERASGLAGGKVAKLDRVEWLHMNDHQQAINALLAGEIDFLEAPPHDLHPLLTADPNIKTWVLNPVGSQNVFRPNHLHKPFDNPKARQALWYAFNQEAFLKAVIGNPAHYKVCKALFGCGTSLASEKGMVGLLESNFEKAKELLRESGYDGTPIVLLHSTDLFWQTNLAPVAKGLMERVGFKVDMQSMDWQTIVARIVKRNVPSEGGWHAVLVSPGGIEQLDPMANRYINSSCDKASFGWPCDRIMEDLRDQFARETDPMKQKDIAEAMQVRVTEWTHYIHLGQWVLVSAARKNVTGFIASGPTVFWNVEKN
jgi:peptide/nickel transport system substrate-binding protein